MTHNHLFLVRVQARALLKLRHSFLNGHGRPRTAFLYSVKAVFYKDLIKVFPPKHNKQAAYWRVCGILGIITRCHIFNLVHFWTKFGVMVQLVTRQICILVSRVRISVAPHVVVAQLVEQWSPKPPVVGSSPSNYAINLCIV